MLPAFVGALRIQSQSTVPFGSSQEASVRAGEKLRPSEGSHQLPYPLPLSA